MKRLSIILGVLLALSLIANVVLLSRTTGSGGQSQGSRVSQNASPFAGMAVPGVKGRTVPKYLKILPNDNALPSVSPKVLKAKVQIGQIQPKAGGWYVRNVILTTGWDASSTINSLGDKFGILPLAIAATIGTESGYNPNAERWGYGIDQSCGLMQQILINVQTVTGLSGIAACRWEEVPANSLWFGALTLANDQRQHPSVPWYWAYAEYNAGSGYPDSWYLNPTGQAYQNLYYNFVPNWDYVLAHDQGGSIPPLPAPPARPKPNPARFTTAQLTRWCSFAQRHHKPCPSPYYRGQLSVVAASWLWGKTVAVNCGGLRFRERYHSSPRYMRTDFRNCIAYSWPWRGRQVKWTKR